MEPKRTKQQKGEKASKLQSTCPASIISIVKSDELAKNKIQIKSDNSFHNDWNDTKDNKISQQIQIKACVDQTNLLSNESKERKSDFLQVKNSVLASQDEQTIKNRIEKFGTIQDGSFDNEVNVDQQTHIDLRKRKIKTYKSRNRVFHGRHLYSHNSELYNRHRRFRKLTFYQPIKIRHKRNTILQNLG